MTDQNNSTNDVDDIDVTDASDVAGVAEVDATGETESVTKQDVPYRSGFVAVVGRPNVGEIHVDQRVDRQADRHRILSPGNHP